MPFSAACKRGENRDPCLIGNTYGDGSSLTIMQRLANKDKSAVKDCLDRYGNLIWTLSKKYNSSIEDAELVTQEIFADVWRHAQQGETSYYAEGHLIVKIAWRRLIKNRGDAAETF